LYNVSFIFQPKCYCRNSQIVRNICIKTYNIETDKKADQKTYKMITKLLDEHEGELHKEEIDYITNFTFTETA
jgi:hypothetical protein